MSFWSSITHLFSSAEAKTKAFLTANEWAVQGLIKWAATFYQEHEGHEKLVTVIAIVQSFLKVAFLNKYSEVEATALEKIVQNVYDKMKAAGEV